MTQVGIVRLGAVLAFAGVALGAFGAHALSELLGEYGRARWETATQYHLIHAAAIALLPALAETLGPRKVRQVAIAFTVGILIFGGSLYLLAITKQRWLGAITPIGGVSFLTGWGLLVWPSKRSDAQ
ncbi:MAG: DUF423 domain-containing protein [Fimbriimonadaceae bacterium]|nr:DUF423 domain-containing protein [Fimbriimonadaceae bacterium]